MPKHTTTTADTTTTTTAAARGLVRVTHDPRHQVVDWNRRETANRPPR